MDAKTRECRPRASVSKKKRSVLQSACDELIDKDSQIAGCVRPELDESFSDRGLVDPQSPRSLSHGLGRTGVAASRAR